MKWLIIVAILMISLPFFIRVSHDINTMPGTESYYHSIADTSISFFSGAHYVWEPFHFVFNWWQYIFGSALYLPALLALGSFILYWLLLNKLKFKKNVKMWSLLVFALSPAFISTGFFTLRSSFAFFCLLLGCVCLLYRWRVIGIFLFAIAGLSGWVAWMGALAFIIFLMILRPFLKKSCLIILGVLFVILVLFPFPPFLRGITGIPGVLGDLGGIFGISIFVMLLISVAAIVLWSNKAKYYSIFALLAALFISCLFLPELSIYANVFASGLAGFALAWLQSRKWELHFLRDVSLLVLFCGLLFSAVSHIALISDYPPTGEFFESLDIDKGLILTHPKYGFWLESAGFSVVADPYVNYRPDAESRLESLDNIFHTNSIKDAKKILSHYDVDYVLITSEMTEGLVWDDDESGLAFLMRNPETFKIVRNTDKVDLWRIR
jgi:hypothetical protein